MNLLALASIGGVIGAAITCVEYLNDVKNASKGGAGCERELVSSLALLFELKHDLAEPNSAKIRQGAVRILSVKDGPFAQCETILKDLQTKLTKDHKFYATVKWKITK
ncbi:hypothetical protein BU23DRAFT_567734 [Bimuria novae-zelandiae CBS 107.79]|uniref:Fungal N-terminal domain-containing protein n=1 Tax=Bimuria novae-zelandiae CBS 107.79 TaxID=1447943 RepID=A0A6A5VE47_9PLEO|nr:hypothetical protein BU23DRAFT_567734 [Bimuria novae-zelandiae CBS 107.79]